MKISAYNVHVVCVHVLVVSVCFPSLVVTGPLSAGGGVVTEGEGVVTDVQGKSECRHGCWGLPPKLHTAIVIALTGSHRVPHCCCQYVTSQTSTILG